MRHFTEELREQAGIKARKQADKLNAGQSADHSSLDREAFASEFMAELRKQASVRDKR